jgi:hypothetical protein
MLGIVAVVLVIGALLCVAGALLLIDGFGAGSFVMRHLTSRNLGSLAPGYANTPHGFAVYARMITAIGVVFLGVAIAGRFPFVGLAVLGVGVVAFAALSVMALRGEVRVYRRVKR